ncbi:MAG: Bax inhibitor-1 family protein [Defluviitaleaceae bacterium]|nr:Bax inhibitor-1 family protein [Defluviitaleaceae bacterium]
MGLPNSFGQPEISDLLSGVMREMYAYISAGLIITTIASFEVARNSELMMLINSPFVIWLILGAQLFLPSLLADKVKTMSYLMGLLLFFLVSALFGVTLSILLLIYTEMYMFSAFLIISLTFAVCAAIGIITKINMTTTEYYFMMGSIGVIIAGIINIFIMNNIFSFIISLIGLFVFMGLTRYDTQVIKQWIIEEPSSCATPKIAVQGALSLYLNLKRIFIDILIAMARSRGRRR